MLRRLHTHLLKYFILLLFYPVFSVRCDKPADNTENIIVQIDSNHTISFNDLKKYAADRLYTVIFRNNLSEAYKRGLDELIFNRLEIIDFFNLGLYKNKELIHGIRRTINEELAIQYFKTQFYEKYVNDKSIQKAYNEMSKEVLYQQIVLAKPENTSQAYIDSLRSTAKDIKTKIDKGADFSEFAKQYSQDSEASRSSGIMPPLYWKKSLTNTPDYIIFNLAAGINLILEDSKSIRIVRVVGINKIEVQPFENVKADIRKTLSERYTDYSNKEFEKYKSNLIDTNRLRWNQKALEQLVKWSRIPNFYKDQYADTLRQAISHSRNMLILKHSNGDVDLKEYLRLIDNVLVLGSSSSVNKDDIKKYILEAVQTNIIVNKAQELNLEKEIFNPETANPIIRNEIAKMYYQQIIESRIPKATGKALREFFEAVKDSLFYQLAKVNIHALITSDEKSINELKHKLDQNIPFEKAAGGALVKTFIRDRDGIIKSYLSIEKPFLGEAAFKLALSETAGPIEYIDPEKGKQYALIKCIVKREEKQLTYEDVKNIIENEFTNYNRAKITHAAQEHLNSKYTVKIFDNALKQSLSSIGINTQ